MKPGRYRPTLPRGCPEGWILALQARRPGAVPGTSTKSDNFRRRQFELNRN